MLSAYIGFETELKRLEKSFCYENAYPQLRKKECTYGYVEIVSCQSDDWWYKDLIGMEFLCRLYFRKSHHTKYKYLSDVTAVALTKSKEIIGRSFDPKDIIII